MLTGITFLICLFSFSLVAQTEELVVAKKLSFVTQKAHFDKEELGISVVIPLATFEEAERNFEKRIDDFTKAKVEHVKGSYRIYPMDWPEVCDTGSVYFGHFEDSEFGLIWLSAVECRDRFIQPNDTKAWIELNRMIKVFAYEVYDDAFSQVIEEQEGVVKEQEKRIKNFEKEQSKATKDISKMNDDIANLEAEIHDYDEELTVLNAAIGKERSSRVGMINEENIKASKQREKDLNKSRDKARKQQSKRKDEILALKQEISVSEQRIADIDAAMPEQMELLADETAELARLESEYAKVKGYAKN